MNLKLPLLASRTAVASICFASFLDDVTYSAGLSPSNGRVPFLRSSVYCTSWKGPTSVVDWKHVMKRRDFLISSTAIATTGFTAFAAERKELKAHRIAKIETGRVQMKWPRLVGKNARLDVHGRGPRISVVRVTTDQGTSGWGTLRGRAPQGLDGKRLTDVFDPATGVTDQAAIPLDVALHDLAGVILSLPVYKMLGEHGPKSSPCYSGMIYFDDLEPPSKPRGISVVLKNCRADFQRGYRQLKVKIGRGNKWMKTEAGLQRDITVTKAIAEEFPQVEILVDGNNGFTLKQIQRYVEGIGDVKLFWIEEPFHETVKDYVKLKTWLNSNGRKTLLADGEAQPDWKVLNELSIRKILDVQLVDIVGYGFTAWRKLMPALKKQGVSASPHCWGHVLKTYYTSHLARGLGNVVTIEGVTCDCGEIDLGKYELNDGRLTPSPDPGFGMTLKA
jgi:L-alanine-DL-glutamate epimerase-like enolase superfamily enzyme